MLKEDDMLNETPVPPMANVTNEATGASQLQSPEETKIKSTATDRVSSLGECGDTIKQQPNPDQRKRSLPVWMLTENLSDQNLSAPVISGENNVIQGSGKEGICKDKTSVKVTWQGRKRLISTENLESIPAEQDAGKKYKNTDQEGPLITSKKVPESFLANTLNSTGMNAMKSDTQRKEIAEEELSEFLKHKASTKGAPKKEGEAARCESPSNIQGQSFLKKSQGSNNESSSGPSRPQTLHAQAPHSVPEGSKESKVNRTSCIYGAKCYRKNPVHFQHFSHPGDSDYESSQALDRGEADDRPECPYGASCYRKNPQHKVEYRHSSHLVAEKHQFLYHIGVLAGKSEEKDDDVKPPSECDLNEEECELTDEDSDWDPGKEDEEHEDMEELLQEAKQFMKRKK